MLGLFGLVRCVLLCWWPCSKQGSGSWAGRGSIQAVGLGGPKVRKARNNVADPLEGGDVFMYRDPPIAHSLKLRRRFEAVLDVLDGMIGTGVSSVSGQWRCILRMGPICPALAVDGWKWQWVSSVGLSRAPLQGQ